MGLDLSWVLALLIIGLVIWKEGNRTLAPIVGPIFAALGRVYGDLRANFAPQFGNNPETKLQLEEHEVTALESEVIQVTDVTKVTLDDMEIAWIAYELGRGATPSATAKTLPGYSPKAYKDHAAKVGMVEVLLAEKGAIERQRTVNSEAIKARTSTSSVQAKAL